MIGIVIVTHGRLAVEFLSAMEHIVGPQSHIKAICIGAQDDVEQRRGEITAAIAAVDLGRGVVLVTDMFGGTPCNLALTHLQKGKVEVLAGANLPSLIKLVSVRTKLSLDAAVREAIEAGRKYMRAGSAELKSDRWMDSGLDDAKPLRAEVEIVNKRGLHARASAKFVEMVARFPCEVSVTKDGTTVSGRSIMGLMMLGAGQGAIIELTAKGPEAGTAMTALVALIQAKFNEDQ